MITERVVDAAAQVLFRTGEVVDLTDLGPHFRQIDIASADLRGVRWVPGQKVQLRTGGLTTRTLTPTRCDTEAGRTSVLAYLHDGGPLSEQVRSLEVGDPCQFLGPRRSLDLTPLEDAPILVGDETSFGLAAAWRAHRPQHPATHVFEASSLGDAEAVLGHLGLEPTALFPADDDTAAVELTSTVCETVRSHTASCLVLTGRAQTIRRVRAALKAAGLARHPAKVKAYWDENRKGLD